MVRDKILVEKSAFATKRAVGTQLETRAITYTSLIPLLYIDEF